MVDFDDGGEGTLSEAGDCANSELLIRSGQQKLVSLAAVAAVFEAEPELEANTLQQIARAAGMASGAATDTNGVVALGLQIEESVEGDDAIYAGERSLGFFGNIFQRFSGKVLMGMMLLNCFQNAEQRARAPIPGGYCLIDENPLFSAETFLRRWLHEAPFAVSTSAKAQRDFGVHSGNARFQSEY